VVFSLEANPFEDTALIPEASKVVNLDTWPLHDPAYKDRVYPIVFGAPGPYKNADGTLTTTQGSPALCVETAPRRLLIAGHRVAANQVTMWHEDPAGVLQSYTRDVTRETDGLGNEVSMIDVAPGPIAADGDAFWITWDRLPLPFTEGVGTGGLINDHWDGNRDGAGELLTYFLRRSTLDFDHGRWRSVENYLDQRFVLAGYIDQVVGPWDFIKQNILPLLPMSLIATGTGIAPVLWRRDAIKADAVGHLTAGPNMIRAGPVNYEKQKIANEIRLTFAPNAENDSYMRTTAVVGYPPKPTGFFSTEYSRASFLRYGQAAESMETDVVFENATAAEILEWKHRAQAFPYRTIKYSAAIRYGFLRRGDLVLITDEELHLSEYLAFVRDMEWANGRPILTLVLVDDPPRENR
jgi:hypothetical protein